MLAGLLNVSITWLISAEGSGVEEPEKSYETPDDLQESQRVDGIKNKFT